MDLKKLPDIQFAERDPDIIIDGIISTYEGLTERKLADGDPVRLFLLTLASIIVQQRVVINSSAKKNLLAYAEGDYLDHLGVLTGTDRLPSAAATTTLQYTLSAAREADTIVPAGSRVTADNKIFFATDEDLVIPAGALTGNVGATCTVVGTTGNNYSIGELNQFVDNIAFVAMVSNITASAGGSDTEKDASYRLRIQESPEKYSVAGSEGAYIYRTKTASSLVADVQVDSPAPGEVVVYPLLEGGQIPDQEMLDTITEALSARDVRPLTDNLTVTAPTQVAYNVTLTYYIDREDSTNATEIRQEVQKAVADFVSWQQARLGRDINPTELYYRLRAAGAKRGDIVEPVFTSISKSQVAVLGSSTVTFGGLEDG